MRSLYEKVTSDRPHHVDINNTICGNLQPYFNTTEPDQMVSRETLRRECWGWRRITLAYLPIIEPVV